LGSVEDQAKHAICAFNPSSAFCTSFACTIQQIQWYGFGVGWAPWGLLKTRPNICEFIYFIRLRTSFVFTNYSRHSGMGMGWGGHLGVC